LLADFANSTGCIFPINSTENASYASVLTIIGGANAEPNTKRQHRDSSREVKHIAAEGRAP
jgi:hypothetical protein